MRHRWKRFYRQVTDELTLAKLIDRFVDEPNGRIWHQVLTGTFTRRFYTRQKLSHRDQRDRFEHKLNNTRVCKGIKRLNVASRIPCTIGFNAFGRIFKITRVQSVLNFHEELSDFQRRRSRGHVVHPVFHAEST